MAHDRAAGPSPARTWHRVPAAWRGRSTVAVGLGIWVVTGWLLVAGAVALTPPVALMLTEAASTPTAGVVAVPAGVVAVPGRTARIYQPGIQGWPIPVDRRAYDEYNRGYLEADDDVMDHAFAAFEWIRVEHHQTVKIIEIDGEAHHVELLEGRNVGRRGWLKTRHLVP